MIYWALMPRRPSKIRLWLAEAKFERLTRILKRQEEKLRANTRISEDAREVGLARIDRHRFAAVKEFTDLLSGAAV